MTTRTFEVSTDLAFESETCYSCGVVFAMTADFRRQRLAHHDLNFFCPNGHQQHYIGETEADKFKRLYEQSERRAGQNYDRAQRVERSLQATRGVVTKLRKRAVAGVCPFGCRRHFVNLERHVARVHLGEELEAERP